MLTLEGRGFLVRTGLDAPWATATGVRALDAALALRAAPWPALQILADLAGSLPGGLHLVWDAPRGWIEELPGEARLRFLDLLASLPRLHLHVQDAGLLEPLQAPRSVWLHGIRAPEGPAGLAWRQGRFTWVPDPPGLWSIPGFGRVAPQEDPDFGETIPPAHLWGEVAMPVGALAQIGPDDLVLALQGAQARLERALSHRLTQGAWHRSLPFQRRRTGWRLALLGGREYLSGGGTWEDVANTLRALVEALRDALKVSIRCGTCHELQVASLLGHQAMREGHPWRYTLPIPPATPTFSPGLGADPRDLVPLEARGAFPLALAELLEHPPLALLRVPALPLDRAVAVFVRGLQRPPAIRWLPPDLSPPGPFLPERPWHPPHLYPPLADPGLAIQQALFEDMD